MSTTACTRCSTLAWLLATLAIVSGCESSGQLDQAVVGNGASGERCAGRPSCDLPNATGCREHGVCTLRQCHPGYVDCDGLALNGCEALEADCPRCGASCVAGPNQEASCVGTQCILRCAAGHADCNGDAADGCETPTHDDVANCGGCGQVCPGAPNRAPTCAQGTCGLGTQRVSLSSAGVQGNDASGRDDPPAVSADGQVIAFASAATTLVAGKAYHYLDVFAHDLATGSTERISVPASGQEAADSRSTELAHDTSLAGFGSSTFLRVELTHRPDSDQPAISADGRYVAFRSFAPNLVADETNNTGAIYVRDRQQGITERVSRMLGNERPNGPSAEPAISADGRFVAFSSRATRLVSGDTNNVADIFVFDRVGRSTSRVSVASDGTQADGPSDQPAISPDGRFVAFRSQARNLVAGDTNGCADIFVHDRTNRSTLRVNLASDGRETTDCSTPPQHPVLSADGALVAFGSAAQDLCPGSQGGLEIVLRDLLQGLTTCTTEAASPAARLRPSLSADGNLLAFQTVGGTNPDGSPAHAAVYLYDRRTGATRPLASGLEARSPDGPAARAVLAADGRSVAFTSPATNLVPGDTNQHWDVFVRPLP